MKSFVVFAMLAAAAVAAPPAYSGDEKHAEVLKNYNDNIGLGEYKKLVETSNGIRQEEEGTLEKINNEGDVASVVRGSFSYPGENGQIFTVTYTADQNGFHPVGEHLPKNV